MQCSQFLCKVVSKKISLCNKAISVKYQVINLQGTGIQAKFSTFVLNEKNGSNTTACTIFLVVEY